ncbi:CAP domain-containing protein [Nodosilinea sp. LEGE 07298]|uniref:CAP domain-containing protein n=1 Tax=Nodosilinea sp. LEGE 07298 TaxID=2777970 RepID=UPI0018800352|nr:CAP domain-containing protein [Nodosilinea sp. LEGE 07298]MBE9108354.1 CAP domain-containing protein [Nodosilinea sp. LEGE 07298]
MQQWKQMLRPQPARAILLAAVLAGLLPVFLTPAAAQRSATNSGVTVAQADIAIDQDLLRLVNTERQRVNAPPLTINDKLTAAAQRHAQDMATSQRMSHDGSDGSTMRSRIDATQYNWSNIGENVAMGQPTAAEVMSAWMNSPGHRRNILNPAFTELGVGYATGSGRIYWVQVFGRPL